MPRDSEGGNRLIVPEIACQSRLERVWDSAGVFNIPKILLLGENFCVKAPDGANSSSWQKRLGATTIRLTARAYLVEAGLPRAPFVRQNDRRLSEMIFLLQLNP